MQEIIAGDLDFELFAFPFAGKAGCGAEGMLLVGRRSWRRVSASSAPKLAACRRQASA
jgi:hypothetical protein